MSQASPQAMARPATLRRQPLGGIPRHEGGTKEAFGTDLLEGKTIAVQGVGNVAMHLCKYLYEEGAQLIVTDIHKDSVKLAVDRYGAKAVDPADITSVACDIYAPCALGGTINDDTLRTLKAKVVAGCANNQAAGAAPWR